MMSSLAVISCHAFPSKKCSKIFHSATRFLVPNNAVKYFLNCYVFFHSVFSKEVVVHSPSYKLQATERITLKRQQSRVWILSKIRVVQDIGYA